MSQYPKLYGSSAWKRLRASQLAKEPLCRMCLAKGIVKDVTDKNGVVDHMKPHRGDHDLFHDPDNLQSLCKRCHDSTKQTIERRGYHVEVDPLTGLPLDANHPFNRRG